MSGWNGRSFSLIIYKLRRNKDLLRGTRESSGL